MDLTRIDEFIVEYFMVDRHLHVLVITEVAAARITSIVFIAVVVEWASIVEVPSILIAKSTTSMTTVFESITFVLELLIPWPSIVVEVVPAAMSVASFVVVIVSSVVIGIIVELSTTVVILRSL